MSSGTRANESRIDISIVVPTFNEEDNVVLLYEELTEVLHDQGKDYEIIFVDDGSTDETFGRLRDVHERDAHLKVVKLRKNFGQSAAMTAGFDHARGDIILTSDADLQNDPHDIPKLVKELEDNGYDCVSGWRWDRKDSLPKRIFSKFSNWLRRQLTDEAIHDSGCTLKAYKRECLHDLELFGEMHRYIPALLSLKGYKIGEVKVAHRPRTRGKTKYNWRRLIKGFLDLLLVTFWQRFSFRPIHIFGGLGLILGLVGIALGLYLVIERMFFGMRLGDRPVLLLAILLVVIGVQFIVSGVLADIMLKIYYGQNNRKNYVVEKVIR